LLDLTPLTMNDLRPFSLVNTSNIKLLSLYFVDLNTIPILLNKLIQVACAANT
jgi:hypothetical protein